MIKGIKINVKTQYVIKSVPSDDTKALENLLNEMSKEGWDLYSLHEIETEDDFQYNCIFTKEDLDDEEDDEDDVVNIKTFKSQMEKMLSSDLSPYETCKDLQEKIKEQRKKIVKIKSQLESQSEGASLKSRTHLNDEISKGLKELDTLRQNLLKTISPKEMYGKLRQDKLSIQLSEEALDLVNPDNGAVLISETVKVRQKLANDLGYVLPKINFEDDDNLNAFEFSIKVRGIEVINSYVYPGYLMFFVDDLNLEKKLKDAIYSVDEITGKKILWIESKKTKTFWQNGLSAPEFVARLLEHYAIKFIDELLDYSDIDQYMEIVSDKNMFLIENVIPDFVSVSDLRYILVNLIREEISIKDIVFIFEKINDFSEDATKEDLLDKIRLSLSRYISKKVSNSDGDIQVFDLSDKTYQQLFSEIDSDDNIVRVDGIKIEKIAKSILKKAKVYSVDLDNLIILAPLEVRHMLFMILSPFINRIKVIAREEVTSGYTIEILDEI